MIARLRILLPYYFNIPHRSQLREYEYIHEGYGVKAYPPLQANVESSVYDIYSQKPILSAIEDLEERLVIVANQTLKVNGQEIIRANLLQFDFFSENDFDRKKDLIECDPTSNTLFAAANIYLARLRTVGRLHLADLLVEEDVGWHVEYLDDLGNKLVEDEINRRKFTSSSIGYKGPIITENVWEKNRQLPLDYLPPVWDTLILDALALSHNVNASIVLANAALEALINFSLEILAKEADLNEETWKWISLRNDDYLRQPSVKEKFDHMLFWVKGISLKIDRPKLWEAFNKLRSARNSIVHEGRALISAKKKERISVDVEMSRSMLVDAQKIINFIESLLPKENRRPIAGGIVESKYSVSATDENSNPKTQLLGIRARPSLKDIQIGETLIKFNKK